MMVVIIAGGSGTRLWPLSTPNYPKHLLKLTNDKSLLQNTVHRVRAITNLERIFVVTEASHANHVFEQLPDIKPENIIVEPARRGTASCVILALAEIRSRTSMDEAILFLWADHIVHDQAGFAATILKASTLAETEKRLVFIGVEPTYASTGFGYMERDGKLDGWQDVYKLASFKEKPSKKIAENYVMSGTYYWNTGYLVGTATTLESEIKQYAPKLWRSYKALLGSSDKTGTYKDFNTMTIDTILSEKVKSALVVPGSFDWTDVGSFGDLHSMSLHDESGNAVTGEGVYLDGVTNSLIRNDSDLPIAVVGIDNVVVVCTINGILVANKNFTQKVGDIAKIIQL